MPSELLSTWARTVAMSSIGQEKDLVRAVQDALGEKGYLDPPSDGMFGPVTRWALDTYLYSQGLSVGQGFTPAIAAAWPNRVARCPRSGAPGPGSTI